MKLLVRALVNALGLWACVHIVSGITVTGTAEHVWLYYVLAGVVLAIVNIFVRPIVKLFALPLYILTLGLFFVVVNAAMVKQRIVRFIGPPNKKILDILK